MIGNSQRVNGILCSKNSKLCIEYMDMKYRGQLIYQFLEFSHMNKYANKSTVSISLPCLLYIMKTITYVRLFHIDIGYLYVCTYIHTYIKVLHQNWKTTSHISGRGTDIELSIQLLINNVRNIKLEVCFDFLP